MLKQTKKIFVSIAVSKPDDLEELPGAITAAVKMNEWANKQGYITLLLHDQDPHMQIITTELLRDKISIFLTENLRFDRSDKFRLVIFFAGHGAAQQVGDQYWILSNWQRRPTEAIKVASLQRMLEYYGLDQVSIIGDCCQEYSSRFIDLIGSAVLDRPNEMPNSYELDQFFAVEVGKKAFMIKAKGNDEAFCVFTEVLLDALRGKATEVDNRNYVVTSQSLARYLQNHVAIEAGKYGVQMIPQTKPGFYTDRIYAQVVSNTLATEDRDSIVINARIDNNYNLHYFTSGSTSEKLILGTKSILNENIHSNKFKLKIISLKRNRAVASSKLTNFEEEIKRNRNSIYSISRFEEPFF